MPLGANVVQLAEQPPADHLDRVVVKDVVVTLVPGGQEEIGLRRDAGHFLALVDAVGHQLLGHHVQTGLHRGDGRRGVQKQRQGDDYRLDAVFFGVGDQLLVAAVNLDVLLRLGLGFPGVDAHQARAGLVGVGAVVIAVERPPHVVRADIGNRLHGDELRIDGPQQHAPLVAGADHADAKGLRQRGVVVEVQRPQAVARADLRLDRLLQQVTADQLAADGGAEVLFSDRSIFRAEIHETFSLLYYDLPRVLGGTPPAFRRCECRTTPPCKSIRLPLRAAMLAVKAMMASAMAASGPQRG